MTEPGSAPARSPFPALPDAVWSLPCTFVPRNSPTPNHDKPEIVDPPFHGMPFGGFGAGTLAQTYRGDFARWHLGAGRHLYRRLPACAHLLAVGDGTTCLDAMALGPATEDGSLAAWTFRNGGARYAALYPFSWLEGGAADGAVSWRLTQHTPLLPLDYEASSYPVAVFRWSLYNHRPAGSRPLTVSVALAWENASLLAPGEPAAFTPDHAFFADPMATLRLGRTGTSRRDEEGAFAIAGTGGDAFVVPLFDGAGDGSEAWSALCAAASSAPRPAGTRTTPARPTGLLGWTASVPPQSSHEVRLALAWHFPVFTFGAGRAWRRRYTHFFDAEVRASATDTSCRIAALGVRQGPAWEAALQAWQAPILASRPPELARALFNGLYILADGGTVWEDGEEAPTGGRTLAPAPEIPGARGTGRFAVLECFTYPYYETLDVRYYGAFPLLFFWPELERQVLLQFAAAALGADDETRDMVHVQETATRKRAGLLPHDLGDPREDPWVRSNAYDDIDPNRWKDLGPKFVLQVVRYLAAIGWEDRGFLRAVWPAVRSAMDNLSRQDRDRDGLPENEGIPDQTFDKWPMTGPSAYCSGLAIAALRGAQTIAEWCGDPGRARAYDAWRRKAVASYRAKLWRGDHVAYDAAPEHARMVMAGQLSGDWGALVAGLATTLSTDETRRVLATISASCATYAGGALVGLRNGAAHASDPTGTDPENRHAREVWPGIAFAVASHMALAGLEEEADRHMRALARVIYEDQPFAFNVPEAWSPDGRFRGALYMRALSIWAVEEAYRRARPTSALPSFFATSLLGRGEHPS